MDTMITTNCPACGETLRWSLSYGEPHWVHTSVLACVQCPDVRASDGLPAPYVPSAGYCKHGVRTGSHYCGGCILEGVTA